MDTDMKWERRFLAIGVLMVLVTTACGSRLSRDEVLSAAREASAVTPLDQQSATPDAAAGVTADPATAGAASAPVAAGSPSTALPVPANSSSPGVAAGSGTGAASRSAGASAPAAAGTPNIARPAAGAAPANAPAAATPGAPAPDQGPTPGETGPIVIGSVGNYSGAPGVAQAPIAKAVQVWAAATNRSGGLLGRQVRVIVVDDGADPARHVAALRDLVENQKVVAFVGNGATLTAAAGRDYLEKVGVPEIGNECTTPPLYWESPIFFPTCANYPDQIFGLAKTAVDFTNETKLAFFYCQEAQTCRDADNALITQGLGKQAGVDVVYRAQVSLVQPDFTSECLNARNAGAKLMIAIITPDALSRFGASCARQNYKPTFVQWAATTLQDSNTKPGLENMVLQTLAHPFPSTAPAVADFHKAFETYADKPGGPPEILGWASSKLFALAATRAAAAAKSVSPKTVLDALHTVSGETLGGLTTPMTFPAGSPVKNNPCWFVARSEAGK